MIAGETLLRDQWCGWAVSLRRCELHFVWAAQRLRFQI